MYPADIRDLDPALVASQLSLRRGQLALLKACPPCQGWSSLRRGQPDDPNNALIDEVWRWTRVLLPKAVMLENVPALRQDPRFVLMLRRLRALGYSARQMDVDAADWGVPQRRRRLILIALLQSEVPLPSELGLLRKLRRPRPTHVRDALAMAGTANAGDPLHRTRSYPERVLLRLEAIPEGGTRRDLPPALRLRCHEALKTRSATSSYGRLRLDGFAHTITTRSTTPACGAFVHPTEPRGLTLREAALLQTFATSYRFVGFREEIGRQIGNALPPRLAVTLGRAVRLLLATHGRVEVRALVRVGPSVSRSEASRTPRLSAHQ